VALVGDFNLSATGPHANLREHREVGSILRGFCDVWQDVHGDPEAGVDGQGDYDESRGAFTFDTKSNAMLRKFSEHERARYDRAMVRGFRSSAIELFGTEPVAGSDGAVFVSDHFGLLCTLTVDDALPTTSVGKDTLSTVGEKRGSEPGDDEQDDADTKRARKTLRFS
jgi:hypothetical protein